MEEKNIMFTVNNKREEINIYYQNEKVNTQMGLPIHNQVMKIKQEFEKVNHPSLQEPEMRRVLCGINRQRRSRSPLGLAERPISVGINRNNCCV